MHEDTFESAKPGQNRRLFPRLNAGLPIRIQSTDANGATDYLAGKDPESTAWVTPDPYMNFSVEGLELNATQSFPKGQILLIELRIGTQDQSWRCTGHVVRNSPSDDPVLCHFSPKISPKCTFIHQRSAQNAHSITEDHRENDAKVRRCSV